MAMFLLFWVASPFARLLVSDLDQYEAKIQRWGLYEENKRTKGEEGVDIREDQRDGQGAKGDRREFEDENDGGREEEQRG